MSWRARSSTTSKHGDRTPNNNLSSLSQRSKTAVSKSKEERNQERDVLMGWEGQDAYLQFEPIGIEVWEKRSSKPKQVRKQKTQDEEDWLPWEFYLCWTYTKCSTIPDYDLFVADSLDAKFKPEGERAIDQDDETLQYPKIQSDAPNWSIATQYAPSGDQMQRPSSVCVEIEIVPNANAADNEDQYEQNKQSCAIHQAENGAARQKEGTSGTFSLGVNGSVETGSGNNDTLKAKPVLNPVLSLADCRESSISQSAPNLRTSEKADAKRRALSAQTGKSSERRVSSAGRRRSLQEVRGTYKEPLNAGNISSSAQQEASKDNANHSKHVFPNKDINIADTGGDKPKLNACDENVLTKAANILEKLRLETPEREIGFDFPQTTHVSLGDLLSSTPRLQRRVGTAKGRDPQVYAALHGNGPTPRPATPEPKANLKSSSNISMKSRLDFDSESKPVSPHSQLQVHESDLPPVKNPRSPRSESGNSPTQASPIASGSSQDGKPLPIVPSSNDEVKRGKKALLSYHTRTEADATNGYPFRYGNPNREVVNPDQYSRPSTSSYGNSPRDHENGDVRNLVKTRGPPGFRPQGQKTPLHRAMENAHKKLYGQHYNLLSQANYGQFGQQERQPRAASSNVNSHSSQRRAVNKGHEISSNSKTWPQQIENRIRQYRSTTAPTRRMFRGTSGAHGGATPNKHTGPDARGDYRSNSKHNRKNSAQMFISGDGNHGRYAAQHT